MIQIVPYEDQWLSALQGLVNLHIEAVVPGWALPADLIRARLTDNPEQPILNRWVGERQTFCALEDGLLVGAAHVLCYRADADVGEGYRHAADIAWLVLRPGSPRAGAALIARCHEQMSARDVRLRYAWDSGLPITAVFGIPDVWPHLRALFTQAGYQPDPERREAIFGGYINDALAGDPPVPGVSLRREQSEHGVGFFAYADGMPIGWCQCVPDLTLGGDRLALRGWAELAEVYVEPSSRGRGIGTWLVRHACAWLRLAGCDRVVLNVAAADEAAGAGRFYQRLGWDALSRCEDAWQHQGEKGDR